MCHALFNISFGWFGTHETLSAGEYRFSVSPIFLIQTRGCCLGLGQRLGPFLHLSFVSVACEVPGEKVEIVEKPISATTWSNDLLADLEIAPLSSM